MTIKNYILIILSTLLFACGQQLVEFGQNVPDSGPPPVITAPVVVLTSPTNNETSVATNRVVSATFSKDMDPSTITSTNMVITGPAGTVQGVVAYAPGSFAAIFTPASILDPLTTYTVTIRGISGVKDTVGTFMVADYVWSFQTASLPDLIPPKISSTSPVDLSTNVPVNTKISATFTKPMAPLTIDTVTYTVNQGLILVVGTVSYDTLTNIATFTSSNPLAFDTTYTVTISNAVTDLAGNALVSGLVPNPWSFRTAPDVLPIIIINMGLASTYGIAATAGVTNTITAPITHINGDVILTPNQTCNAVVVDNIGGFGLCNNMSPTINGRVVTDIYPDTTTAIAVKADLNAAFLSITPPAGPPAAGGLPGGIPIAAPTTMGALAGSALVLGNNWFTPGVYISITSVLITGDITLDGQGDPNAIFIFQSASSLTTADGAPSPAAHVRVLLVNGAKASNVWWQVASSATLGLYSDFSGNILAAFDITMKTGATSCGRLMSGAWVGGSGAFVFDNNVVSVPGNGCPL